MRPRCQRKSTHISGREAGFTLMELIIVSTLVTLFLSISIPTLRNSLVVNQLDSTARKTIGTIKELRNLAVREHKPYLLHLELDENRIWFEPDTNTKPLDDTPETGLQFPAGVNIEKLQTRSQGQKSFGSVTLWINARGYMDETAVYLSDDDGGRLTLFFSPFSGSARVFDDFVEFK